MKFSKKTAHRLLICLFMFAPVVYLFGVMFSALAGWNTQELGSSEEVVLYTESKEYNQRLINPAPTSLDGWYGENGVNLSFDRGLEFSTIYDSTGVFTIPDTTNFNDGDSIFVRFTYSSDVNLLCNVLGYRPNIVAGEGVFYGIGTYSSSQSRFGIYTVSTGNVFIKDLFLMDINISGFGNGVEASYLNSVFVNSYYDFTYSSELLIDVFGVPDFSQYLFNQFFPKDNFLERVGSNALSSNPVGFAPFATLIQYLDSNLFHGSNSQIALMFYGEVYWALNVVMADLVYHVLVWIPNLVNRVFDWFDSKGLSDE